MGFDGNTQFLCLLCFRFIEFQRIAKVLQTVCRRVRQQMFGDANGVDEGVTVDKPLFLQHAEVKLDVVGDEIVLRCVVLLNTFGEGRFGVGSFVGDNLRGDVVYLHRLDTDGNGSRA